MAYNKGAYGGGCLHPQHIPTFFFVCHFLGLTVAINTIGSHLLRSGKRSEVNGLGTGKRRLTQQEGADTSPPQGGAVDVPACKEGAV
jgi:hypothetical protein